MSNRDLINNLSENLEPANVLDSPIKRCLKWAVGTLLIISIGVLALGVRSDIFTALQTPKFWLENSLLLASILCAAAAAFLMSGPGREAETARITAGGAIGIWMLVALFLGDAGNLKFSAGYFCISSIIAMSIFPAGLLLVMVSKAAPLNKGLVGLCATLAAASSAGLGMQFVCRNSDTVHMLAWHVLPVVFVGSLGLWIGKIVFKWDK